MQVGIITAADGHDVRTRFEFLGVDHFYEKSKVLGYITEYKGNVKMKNLELRRIIL